MQVGTCITAAVGYSLFAIRVWVKSYANSVQPIANSCCYGGGPLDPVITGFGSAATVAAFIHL